MFGEILLRYRLSGNGHPGSAKNPGPDPALAEICYWLPFSYQRATFYTRVVSRQGGLVTNVKILSYVESWAG